MQLIILDRDGVINHDSDAYIKSVDEWIPLPGAISAMARLTQAGWTIAIATNQSGIARGYYSEATLQAMHDKMRDLLQAEGGEVGYIAYCPHGPDQDCACRKPKPGMLQTIAEYYKTDLTEVWFVGDSLRDLQAAAAVKARPVLVKTGKGNETVNKTLPADTLIFSDLAAVADYLIGSGA